MAGFGWLNDSQFVYAHYDCDMKNDSENRIAANLLIKTDKIKISPYIKKGNEQPVEGEMPTGFAITLFNIIFMYPTNITVISKLTN